MRCACTEGAPARPCAAGAIVLARGLLPSPTPISSPHDTQRLDASNGRVATSHRDCVPVASIRLSARPMRVQATRLMPALDTCLALADQVLQQSSQVATNKGGCLVALRRGWSNDWIAGPMCVRPHAAAPCAPRAGAPCVRSLLQPPRGAGADHPLNAAARRRKD
jgi:hypothetical protein